MGVHALPSCAGVATHTSAHSPIHLSHIAQTAQMLRGLFQVHFAGRLASPHRLRPSSHKHLCVVMPNLAPHPPMWMHDMVRSGVPKPLVLMVLLLTLTGDVRQGEACETCCITVWGAR